MPKDDEKVCAANTDEFFFASTDADIGGKAAIVDLKAGADAGIDDLFTAPKGVGATVDIGGNGAGTDLRAGVAACGVTFLCAEVVFVLWAFPAD